MYRQKLRLSVLAMFFVVALVAPVSPVRATSPTRDESEHLSSKNVTALDALDFFDSSIAGDAAASEPASIAGKPEAPAPKIATDSDFEHQAQQNGSDGNPSQQNPTGPPSNPTGQQDDNPKR